MDFSTPRKEHPPVAVTEVGTRDGFQAEERFIDTAVKAEIIDAMIAAGVRHIEATSFVSPRAVPQLADAHEVLSRLTRRKDAHIAALVPNARGAERALGAGVDEAVCFVSASETHNGANLNTSIGEALANVCAHPLSHTIVFSSYAAEAVVLEDGISRPGEGLSSLFAEADRLTLADPIPEWSVVSAHGACSFIHVAAGVFLLGGQPVLLGLLEKRAHRHRQ
jgi:hypothetical protein